MGWRPVAFVMLAFSHLSQAQVPSAPISAEKEYVGCLTLGFEDAFFRPIADQGRVQWWIARVPDNFSSWVKSVPAESGRRVMFARVIAKVSNTGRFGLGMGSREIEIAEVLELRGFQESDGICELQLPPPPPPPPPESFPEL